jgi:hypothetical protein
MSQHYRSPLPDTYRHAFNLLVAIACGAVALGTVVAVLVFA